MLNQDTTLSCLWHQNTFLYTVFGIAQDSVWDPGGMLLQVLFKMLNSGVFSEINGCISTGKEANVYHAVTQAGEDLAVKVYKTSILVFKDRDRCARLSCPRHPKCNDTLVIIVTLIPMPCVLML